MDVSLLQVEATRNGAVADPLAKQGEGQPDSLGQGQTGSSSQPSAGLRGLKQLCDSLEEGKGNITVDLKKIYIFFFSVQIFSLVRSQ